MAAAVHTLAAVFPSRDAAANGVRYLERVGFEPWRIALVEDPQRALEISVRRYGGQGLIVGFIAGVAFVAFGLLLLDVRLPGIEGVVVPVAVIGGSSLIGFLAGYAIKRRGLDAELLESALRRGGGVVAVSCSNDCDLAAHAFAEAGASEVLDETAPTV